MNTLFLTNNCYSKYLQYDFIFNLFIREKVKVTEYGLCPNTDTLDISETLNTTNKL